jgi:hypothetical protein
MTDEIDYWRQCAADANAQLNAMRKRAEDSEAEMKRMQDILPLAWSVSDKHRRFVTESAKRAAEYASLGQTIVPLYARATAAVCDCPADKMPFGRCCKAGQPATLPIEIAGNLLPDDYVSPRLAAEAYRESEAKPWSEIDEMEYLLSHIASGHKVKPARIRNAVKAYRAIAANQNREK